ncbi:hypothetical protein EUGRSUZ_E01676 [Eucalyptus grandis]|uniref:Uncharacterized protein n=2 Tax=Eucalyptus grandis TaxID=71139 RepID=A0ACC3KUU6_EUCGR|nr:hypothetical protein EUGRSUZ_E01676 [Eucalyptus grandis]
MLIIGPGFLHTVILLHFFKDSPCLQCKLNQTILLANDKHSWQLPAVLNFIANMVVKYPLLVPHVLEGLSLSPSNTCTAILLPYGAVFLIHYNSCVLDLCIKDQQHKLLLRFDAFIIVPEVLSRWT